MSALAYAPEVGSMLMRSPGEYEHAHSQLVCGSAIIS